MAKCWLFIVCAVAVVGANADDLSDFSNNLATDIGPLLVLFGESMTRQYLSESTSFLDYFIFAMAPIGILTAVVSTIRVCGHSSLRAFIGRSQEGDGVVEAELCTSTSRDVCELFNRGGITRVLGRPNILELVHVRGPEVSHPDPDKAGLFLFRSYLEKEEPDTSGWKKLEGSSVQGEVDGNKPSRANLFAPNPNLSLNVGIVKRSRWVFFAVGAAGFILQAGVLALAGIGVWILHWNLNGDASSSTGYAPVMFIAGTILMCGGMWSCAALIGQSTHELCYRRQASSPTSRLLWLQPGPQVIGDQSFDSFAYFENKNNPLQVWTSSKKDFDEKFELYTFLAASAVLIGYIMQFIGLRGMKAWVSLAQLGATIVMSILRGSLRMQRLNRGANKLGDMPDLVVGHELDWLAFELAQQEAQQGSFWHISGQYEKAVDVETQNSGSTNASQAHETSSQDNGKDGPAPTSSPHSPTTSPEHQSGQVDYKDLLPIRVRLAHLTGHISLSNIEDREYQKWKDGYVKVRTKAGKLSAAICQAAESLPQKEYPKSDIVLRIKAVTSPNIGDRATHREQLISVTLKPPPESTQTGWKIDSARLEAILGLWMWSLVSDERLETKDDSSHKTSLAEIIERARIVSAGPDNNTWDHKSNRQGEMDLWLGPNAIKLPDTTLTLDNDDDYGLINLWRKHKSDTESDRDYWSKEEDKSQSYGSLQRFCGWNPVYESLRSGPLDSIRKLRVQFYSTNLSLLDICAQELFAALTISLTGLLSVGETTLVESAGNVRLDNPTVSALAKAFVEGGLGSYSDAILCIVPAFGNQLPLPAPKVMLEALMGEAETYRKKSEWKRAEILLRWACQRYCRSDGREEGSTPTASDSRFIAKALRATGELYRWSLAHRLDDDRKKFGIKGVEWMTEGYSSAGQSNPEVTEILDCYQAIAKKIAEGPAGKGWVQDTDGIQGTGRTQHPLLQAIQDRTRKEALYHLCFITTGEFGSEYLEPALPLAVRNDWSEVVYAILEMKANPNSQDEDGRTAISYCAQFGYQSYLRPFIDLGTFLDQPDKDQRTPLHWAAQTGRIYASKLLLDTGHVDLNRRDVAGWTPLRWAAEKGHEAVVRLLLEKGADTEATDKDGWTPLRRAAENGHEAVVRLLLEKGAELESKDEEYTNIQLSIAARYGHEAVVRLLLEKGADTEAKDKDKDGWTPLRWAAENGHEAVVRLLLEKGAELEAKDEDYRQTPLGRAAENGHEAVVRLLLEKGADTEATDKDGWTPLRWAAEKGHEAVVQLLLEKGAELESKDEEYNNIQLSIAARYGHEAVVRLLLEKGAKLESKDKDYGQMPLWWAAENGHEAVMKLLLEKGADTEAKDEDDGRTPLRWAAENGHEAVVQLLLEKGADTEAKDNGGRTPLSWAAENGHESVVRLLK
ncbi:ankyrin repeat-containing domain protein [Ilyonectria destructans]|nr:ankyrin repeat-containing domain protein [Ilyonectria destructans]